MPLAAWFHLSKYDEKIKDALYYECILEVLSAPPTIEISPYLPQNATLSLMICIQFIYQHGRGRDWWLESKQVLLRQLSVIQMRETKQRRYFSRWRVTHSKFHMHYVYFLYTLWKLQTSSFLFCQIYRLGRSQAVPFHWWCFEEDLPEDIRGQREHQSQFIIPAGMDGTYSHCLASFKTYKYWLFLFVDINYGCSTFQVHSFKKDRSIRLSLKNTGAVSRIIGRIFSLVIAFLLVGFRSHYLDGAGQYLRGDSH